MTFNGINTNTANSNTNTTFRPLWNSNNTGAMTNFNS